uniref:HMG box domain-containing protein n=1 Tax=Ditylenchus dipsaci TaxID=166011 RepID=A0A915D905_9BILA
MQTRTDDGNQSELDLLEFMDSEEKDQQCQDVNDKSQEITEDADLQNHSDISNENFQGLLEYSFWLFENFNELCSKHSDLSQKQLLIAACVEWTQLDDKAKWRNYAVKRKYLQEIEDKRAKTGTRIWASDSRRRFPEKFRGKSAAELREAWLEVEDKSKWDQLAAIDKKRYVEDRKKAGLHPLQPTNAYAYSMGDNRRRIAKQHVGVSIQELQAFISAEWKSVKDKSKWESMAAEDTKRFEQEMQVYSEAKNPTEEPCSSPSSIMIMPIGSETSSIAFYNLYQLFHSKPSAIKSSGTKKQPSIFLACRNKEKKRHSSRLAASLFKKEHYVQPNTPSPSIACAVADVQQPTCYIHPALLTECYEDNRPLGRGMRDCGDHEDQPPTTSSRQQLAKDAKMVEKHGMEGCWVQVKLTVDVKNIWAKTEAEQKEREWKRRHNIWKHCTILSHHIDRQYICKLEKKISSEVTACKKCDPTVFLKMTDGSTKLLRKHIEIHAEEAAIFKKLEEEYRPCRWETVGLKNFGSLLC